MPEHVRPVIEGKPVKMTDRVKHIVHREKKPVVGEKKPSVPVKIVEKQTLPKKKTTSVATPHSSQVTPPRPIEQVFVGAWNAVKPESQGKAIMKVYDKYIHPKYQNEEERKRAATLRPKIEKIVGWTAVGTEAALITFGAVKGFQKLRSVDWGKFRRNKGVGVAPHDVAVRVLAEAPLFSPQVKRAADRAMAQLYGQDISRVLPGFAEGIRKMNLPPDVRNAVSQEYFQQVFARLQDPGFLQQINQVKLSGIRKDMIRDLMQQVQKDVLQNGVGAFGALSPERVPVVQELLGLIRMGFMAKECPGAEVLGVRVKLK